MARFYRYTTNRKSRISKKLSPEIEKFIEFQEKTGNSNYSDFLATQKDWSSENHELVLKELIKMKKYGLKLTSDFRLEAGDLDNINHDQGKLENYYKSLGFKKGKQVDDPETGQPFKQSISSFLKNCEKFKENPLESK